MNFSGAGVVYGFLIIPLAITAVVIVQGVQKIQKGNSEGYVAIGFGVVFLILITLAYVLYIK